MAGAMAQKLKALATLYLGSIPKTHMVAHSPLEFQFHGFKHLFLIFVLTRHTCGAQTFMPAKHPSTLKKKKTQRMSEGIV